MSEQTTSERFDLLQILRAIAALMVVVHHAIYEAGLYTEGQGCTAPILVTLPWMAGVDLFFVISGFVMVYASRNLFEESGAWHLFLRRRIARIVPLYWFVTLLVVLLMMVMPSALNTDVSLTHIVASFLFIPMINTQGNVQPLFTLGWTLNFELFFYVLFAIILVFPWRMGLSLLALIMCVLVGLGAFFSLPLPFEFWTRPIILEFLGGVAIGALWLKGITLSNLSRILLSVAGFSALLLNGSENVSQTGWETLLFHGVPSLCLVSAAVLGEWRDTSQNRLIRFGVMMGNASYALYLTHPFVIKGLHVAIVRGQAAAVISPILMITIAIVLSMIIATTIYHLFEQPMTRAMRAFLNA